MDENGDDDAVVLVVVVPEIACIDATIIKMADTAALLSISMCCAIICPSMHARRSYGVGSVAAIRHPDQACLL